MVLLGLVCGFEVLIPVCGGAYDYKLLATTHDDGGGGGH
jgi:hypothetical protein